MKKQVYNRLIKRGNDEDKNCDSWTISKFVHFGLAVVLLLLAAVVRVLHHLVFVVSEPDGLV